MRESRLPPVEVVELPEPVAERADAVSAELPVLAPSVRQQVRAERRWAFADWQASGLPAAARLMAELLSSKSAGWRSKTAWETVAARELVPEVLTGQWEAVVPYLAHLDVP